MGKWLKFKLLFTALGISCILVGCSYSKSSSGSADGYAVYYNAKVYTADNDKPSATAFVVRNGEFVYVGDDRGALNYGKGIDMHGKRVIPGMIDSHCHPVLTSALLSLDLLAVDSGWNLEETLAFLKEKAAGKKHKNLPFIIGMGFGTNCRPAHATDLDKAIPDRPAIIFSSDAHAYWLNTKAMKMAKLTKDTPDPVPGASFFERDAQGNPTGYVVESTAGFYLMRRMGIFTPELIKDGLHDILRLFSENGITAVFEAGVCAVPEEVALKALYNLEKKDELPMRFFTSYVYFGKNLDKPENMIKVMRKNRKKYSTEFLRADVLKIIGDGTLEVQSAWMHEDYLSPAKGRGAMLISVEDMLAAATLAAAEGFNIHNHAIGDATIDATLDFYKKLGKIRGTKTICHVQVLPDDGIPKFIEQNDIFYQTTPAWLMDDKFTRKVLGKERYLRQVPLASLIKGGVKVTFGSDFPVSNGEVGLNPFNNMWNAVCRATDKRITPPESEAITVKDCVDAYTINGARQLGAEDRIGSITVGKSADFVVCSEDIFAIEPEKLREVKVEKTFILGECVYNAQKYELPRIIN